MTNLLAHANFNPAGDFSRGFFMTLDELNVGQTATVVRVGGEGSLRLRLLDMGLIPRTVVRVQKRAPMGDPIELRLRGYELTLRKEDAGKIEVEGADK